MRLEVAFVVLALSACAAPQPPEGPREVRELAGRAAGPPQRCVSIQPSASLRVSDTDRHTLIYGSGRTIWANDLSPGCSFGANDILVTQPTGSFYCRGDIVRSFDRYSRIPGPSCVLGDFVPFNR